MLDDAGYGATGTFGGVVPTPAMERVAKNGLRYTNFHTTSLAHLPVHPLSPGATITLQALELLVRRFRDTRDTILS